MSTVGDGAIAAHSRANAGEDEYVAVRAVNAHTFCPRLYWLEHVEGIFVDNEHTIAGQHVHRRVDKPGGKLAAPTEEGGATDPEREPWHARSLWLSCASLGISGKLDLVEEEGADAVRPVDTKKGRSCDGELWPPDEVQLTLQALLLEAHGYTVKSVAAWYAAERRRVVRDLSDEMRKRAREAVGATKATRDGNAPPLPLRDSSRCYGCSLNIVCLPDETLRLHTEQELREGAAEESAQGEEPTLRRVVPPRPDVVPLYVQEQGALVRLSQRELQVRSREGELLQKMGIEGVGQINLYGMVHVTGPVIREALDRDVPVCFFSRGGWYRGRTSASMSRSVHVRIAQYQSLGDERALAVARGLIADKIANGRTLLRRNAEKSDELRERLGTMARSIRTASTTPTAEALLGVEGYAARSYWEAFSTLVARDDEAFAMKGRTRRPPQDRTNAMLSYLYGMLVKDCSLALEGIGFDPFIGLYHTNHHGRPSMALDLMEPFRPLVADSVVLGMVRRREVEAKDFVIAGQQVSLRSHARKAVIRAYERRMDEMVTHPEFGYSVTYRQLLYVHARLISRYLLGDIEIVPRFRTR